jgi:radical SAM-linked protein
MVTRPVRERKLERVDELLKRTLASTGYEEVSLVSLSTCDYSRVRQLVENTVETLRDENIAISLPSLRLDSFSVDLADMVAETRRTGLTFAPEAASPRLRALINKWIPDEDLLGMADRAFELGWGHVKLYFMLGLPTERDDDILAIADLARRTLQVGKRRSNRSKVNLGVSTFVPKPFTPFQWSAQIDAEETERRQRLLGQALDNRDIKFGRHEPAETFLEGLVSRADRRAADLIEAAFRLGCRMDAWSEHLRFDLWKQAIAETGYDVADALRERDTAERLPWDHLDVFVPKDWLVADWHRALELKHAEDCRHKRCHKCGVIDVERALCAAMLRDNVEGRKTEAKWTRKELPKAPDRPTVQRLRLRVAKTGKARFLSHLETMNAWIRALRRAGAPLGYSEGFHPHPKVAFSAALPVGEESLGEYIDVELWREVDGRALQRQLVGTLPDGMEVLDITEVELKAPALMAMAAGGIWRVVLKTEELAAIAARIDAINAAPSVVVQRRAKRKDRRGREEVYFQDVDIRPMIQELVLEAGTAPCLRATLVSVNNKPGKIGEIVRLLTERPDAARVVKVDTLRIDPDGPASISHGWAPPPAREGRPGSAFVTYEEAPA